MIAPILVRANEEHLNAGIAAFAVQTDDVSFLDSLRVDTLDGLHLGQRMYPVAQRRGAFKVQLGRRR